MSMAFTPSLSLTALTVLDLDLSLPTTVTVGTSVLMPMALSSPLSLSAPLFSHLRHSDLDLDLDLPETIPVPSLVQIGPAVWLTIKTCMQIMANMYIR